MAIGQVMLSQRKNLKSLSERLRLGGCVVLQERVRQSSIRGQRVAKRIVLRRNLTSAGSVSKGRHVIREVSEK